VADPRWDKDNVPLLEPVAVGTDQVFHPYRSTAEENFDILVTVEADCSVGVAHIPVSVDKTGGHLQLLIEITGINAHFLQMG
jgi:hypothetical protein